MNPLQILAQVMPQAKNDDHLAELAAQLGPPPAGPMMPMGGAAAQPGAPIPARASPLVASAPIYAKPPQPTMTQGEARTQPNIGATLLGV